MTKLALPSTHVRFDADGPLLFVPNEKTPARQVLGDAKACFLAPADWKAPTLSQVLLLLRDSWDSLGMFLEHEAYIRRCVMAATLEQAVGVWAPPEGSVLVITAWQDYHSLFKSAQAPYFRLHVEYRDKDGQVQTFSPFKNPINQFLHLPIVYRPTVTVLEGDDRQKNWGHALTQYELPYPQLAQLLQASVQEFSSSPA